MLFVLLWSICFYVSFSGLFSFPSSRSVLFVECVVGFSLMSCRKFEIQYSVGRKQDETINIV